MSKQESSDRLGVSFHRGFPFSRNGVRSVLSAVANGGNLQDNTSLGSVQLEAMPRYCERAGLISEKEQVTLFGRHVLDHDPSMSKASTIWVLHYYLSAPHRNAPNFWTYVVENGLVLGQTLNKDKVMKMVSDFASKAANVTFSERTLEGSATAFIGTYSKPENLGDLNALRAEGSHQYTVTQAEPIPTAAFACMLLDYWQAHWPDREQVELKEVTGSELARVLLLSEAQVLAFLAALSAPGVKLVSRQMRVAPYMVTRLWTNEADVWAHLAE